jgi:KDO2-lipid IV(A) lauroyltransferase
MLAYRLLSCLPLGLLYLLAWPGYLLLYYLAGYRKAVVRQNLRQAFPDESEKALTVLAKKFYRQLVQVALEIVRTRRMSAAAIRERVSLVNPELVREYSNDFQQPLIILSIHQGNWEWMLHGISTALDVPAEVIYKPLHSLSSEQLMQEVRSRFGVRPVAMADAPRQILRARRQFRVIGMLADQSPIRSQRSYWTRFLNGEAAFYRGPGVIAHSAALPVLFSQCRRLGPGRYEVEFHEVARPPYTGSPDAIIDRYVQLAEQAIRDEPESWLWSNRRWKRSRPASQDA